MGTEVADFIDSQKQRINNLLDEVSTGENEDMKLRPAKLLVDA